MSGKVVTERGGEIPALELHGESGWRGDSSVIFHELLQRWVSPGEFSGAPTLDHVYGRPELASD